MERNRIIPADPLDFIRSGVRRRSVLWTYHVNMRMKGRSISREIILASESAYEIIESYPDDKYLPSDLVFVRNQGSVYHVLFEVDVKTTMFEAFMKCQVCGGEMGHVTTDLTYHSRLVQKLL